ncbi:MAG: tyrosine-type recombinase/integrase [Candidatus Dormibacteraeota bacterium]|nr:tyrosine-type recombinase/integrase [Candidatus Dormibacteraeota bacterium]
MLLAQVTANGWSADRRPQAVGAVDNSRKPLFSDVRLRMLATVAALPLSQAIDEFLSWQELDRHRSPGTITEYRKDLAGFAAFAGGDAGIRDVAELHRDLLRAYQRHLGRLRVRSRAAERPLGIATRHRRLVTLRSFLRFAAREEWLAGDLGSTIDLPRLPERLPKPLEPGVREQLLEALPAGTLAELRDRALFAFLLSTGCRIAEALALDRDELRRERVVVRGKGDRERVVLLTDRARHAVQDYLAARTDDSPALFISFQPASKGTSDNRLTAAGARHICQRVSRELAVSRFHPHQLRHTLGTLLQEAMGDARLTAETLGHRGLGSVAGYTKVSNQRRRDAYEELEARGL